MAREGFCDWCGDTNEPPWPMHPKCARIKRNIENMIQGARFTLGEPGASLVSLADCQKPYSPGQYAKSALEPISGEPDYYPGKKKSAPEPISAPGDPNRFDKCATCSHERRYHFPRDQYPTSCSIICGCKEFVSPRQPDEFFGPQPDGTYTMSSDSPSGKTTFRVIRHGQWPTTRIERHAHGSWEELELSEVLTYSSSERWRVWASTEIHALYKKTP